ncbi:MAG: DUF937 domain-containing protein, partial [Pseudomonadota bacterium]
MKTLFDIMLEAQNGTAMTNMAQQFGLSQQQAEDAMAALLPAFSTGLKRSTDNPGSLAGFLGAMAQSPHVAAYDDAVTAFQPQMMEQGNNVLGQIFGGKETSRAVTAQAAQVTGIGQEILKQMLPVVASMIMGGLTRQWSQPSALPGGAGSNPFGQMMEQMMGGLTGGTGRSSQPMANPFQDMFEQMMSGASAAGPGTHKNPDPINPLQDMMDIWMR